MPCIPLSQPMSMRAYPHVCAHVGMRAWTWVETRGCRAIAVRLLCVNMCHITHVYKHGYIAMCIGVCIAVCIGMGIDMRGNHRQFAETYTATVYSYMQMRDPVVCPQSARLAKGGGWGALSHSAIDVMHTELPCLPAQCSCSCMRVFEHTRMHLAHAHS